MSNKKKTVYPERSRRVFVAMSGGVDSSVAALLLKNRSYNVVGVFMRCYNLDGCAEQDAEDARRVAEHLGIPFYVWDFEKEYKKRVVDYMINGYRNGITPNPDVMCNKEIKFGLFFKKAIAAGADYITAGHYVKLKNGKLFAAKDKNKDQSYFLWTLAQEQLQKCLFPIGDYVKPEVRKIARKAGLPTAEKKDSQGICFLGKVSVADFLKQHIPERQGAVLLARRNLGEGGNGLERKITYEKIGEHAGAAFYTIGQRHIGVSLVKSKWQRAKRNGINEPIYVVEKDVRANTLVVVEGDENAALYRKEVELVNVNFINSLPFAISPLPVFARVRYRQPVSKATLEVSGAKTARLVFKTPQKFVAPGQSAVFYSKKGEVLGGGIIC